MGTPSSERVKEVFNQVVDLPVGERASFLAAACGADEALRQRVEQLLRSLEDAGSFLAAPTRSSVDGPVAPGIGLAAGATLGSRYRILRFAGRGGMGEVYRAEDLELGQAVALKLLPEELMHDLDRLARLRDEVRTARQVSHPNVCRVYDIGEAEGWHFLTMEWIEGEDLESLLKRTGTPAPDRALSIARQVAAGLAAAHDRGVLHRDLKPSNVMIDHRGIVRIADFGLAVSMTAVSTERAREDTPRYMSPEQLAGREVTFQSDLYALGLTLYELVTGQRAYAGATLEEITQRRRHPPTPPSRLAPGVDPAVEKVILRCLDPDPARRPPGARAVLETLPGEDSMGDALLAAQQRADRIAAFRTELAELRQAGLLEIDQEALLAVDAHHDRVLRDLMERFDVDVSERGKQLSLGVRAVSLVAAVALAASVYYFFYRVWGVMTTTLQVAILVTAPIVVLVVTSAVARRERSGYFTLITALAALSAVVVGSVLLGTTFNLSPSPVAVFTWGLFALVLAYGFGLRLPLVIGLGLSSTFVAGVIHQAAGGLWQECFARPESFMPAGLLLSAVALRPPRYRRRQFASIYGALAITLLAVPAVALGMVGAGSYLSFDVRAIESAYQLLGFAVSAGAIWWGVVTRRREAVYGGAFFFVTLLFLVFFKWWWNWMPRYVFFLVVALAAMAVMLVLKRLRADFMARWAEVAP